jgi:hypothetical protein
MAETDPLEQLIQETRAFVETRPAPDVVSAVMRQIEQLEPTSTACSSSWIARFGRSLWTPRLVAFELRPAYGLVAAAVLTLTVVVAHDWSTDLRSGSVATTDSPSQQVYVQFRLESADASEVRLAGSFTHWQPAYQLHQTAPGVWTVTLPLAPGVHDYAFIVDGRRWVTDPYAPSIQDGFGGTNSRITLVTGGDRHL